VTKKLYEPKRRGRLNTLLLAITLQVQDFRKITEHYLRNLENLPQIPKENPKDEHVAGWTWKEIQKLSNPKLRKSKG
jgi:hypothetical protein